MLEFILLFLVKTYSTN